MYGSKIETNGKWPSKPAEDYQTNGHVFWTCYLPYHRSNSISMLCRRIVDHQTLPVVCSLFLSGQFLSQPESTICENTLTLSLALHLSTDSTQHMYTHPTSWITVTHGADTICSVFLVTCLSYYSTCYFLLFHMLFLNLPHARCPSLPVMFHPFSI